MLMYRPTATRAVTLKTYYTALIGLSYKLHEQVVQFFHLCRTHIATKLLILLGHAFKYTLVSSFTFSRQAYIYYTLIRCICFTHYYPIRIQLSQNARQAWPQNAGRLCQLLGVQRFVHKECANDSPLLFGEIQVGEYWPHVRYRFLPSAQ